MSLNAEKKEKCGFCENGIITFPGKDPRPCPYCDGKGEQR